MAEYTEYPSDREIIRLNIILSIMQLTWKTFLLLRSFLRIGEVPEWPKGAVC
jgi:hypothetical protein